MLDCAVQRSDKVGAALIRNMVHVWLARAFLWISSFERLALSLGS